MTRCQQLTARSADLGTHGTFVHPSVPVSSVSWLACISAAIGLLPFVAVVRITLHLS